LKPRLFAPIARYPDEDMISILNLGRCDYATALRLQETLVELCKQQRASNVLLFVEHPPVITLGRNARASNIVAPRQLLASQGVEIHEINRGGDVTFHGPGQLVAYPIFDLRSFEPKLGVIAYVRLLEQVLMRVCAHYAIETQRIAGMTGVWTYPTLPPRLNPCQLQRDHISSSEEEAEGGEQPDTLASRRAAKWPERKIAAIGVHVSRSVTSHGFALNVTTPLDFFQLIVPCGLAKPVTSIEFETGLRPSLDEVMTIASRTFGELFHSQMLWLESIHDLIPEISGEAGSPAPAAPPQDTPARAPENERRVAHDDIHLA
jgi:lipoyl(octanoyl) transferase